jgi:hypothetical protein
MARLNSQFCLELGTNAQVQEKIDKKIGVPPDASELNITIKYELCQKTKEPHAGESVALSAWGLIFDPPAVNFLTRLGWGQNETLKCLFKNSTSFQDRSSATEDPLSKFNCNNI